MISLVPQESEMEMGNEAEKGGYYEMVKEMKIDQQGKTEWKRPICLF